MDLRMYMVVIVNNTILLLIIRYNVVSYTIVIHIITKYIFVLVN
jgi:hypothetical protein